MNTVSIVIVGVGGQGTLLASRILGKCAMDCGYDVKVSEVHGMSQRGGSVITYVRYGDRVASPLVENGGADILLSFEQLECLRWLPMLKKGGTAVCSEQQIAPMPVITGQAVYPADIDEQIRAAGVKLISCDALAVAEELGNIKAVNVVLIGMLAANSAIPKERFIAAITATVKPQFIDLNLKAFEAGYARGQK